MFGIDGNVLVFIFLAVIAVGGLAFAFLFNQVESERTREKRIKNIKSKDKNRESRLKTEKKQADANKRRQTVAASLKELEENTKKKNPNASGLKENLRQAGMEISISKFYVFSVIFGIIFSIVALVVSGNIFVFLAAIFIGTLGLPRWFVAFKKKRRMEAFLNEFPNAVDVITRGIKAGLPLNDCMGIIASEAKEPVRTEFKRVMDTQKLGIPMTEAILKLYKSVPLTEANFFGIVIAIQQSAGGNLSEALANLSVVLRERKKMKGKIKAMSSEAKASAGIIGCLPVAVCGILFLTAPDYIILLFSTFTGNILLIISGVWMSLGIFVMKQMINFDF